MPKWSEQSSLRRWPGSGLDGLDQYLGAHEEWLMERILDYAVEHDYARYTSTLKEAWRASIAGLSASIGQALAGGHRVPEFGPDEAWEEDPCAHFGLVQAQRHRTRGVTLGMFLGLMKYYRQAYLDLLQERPCPGLDLALCDRFVQRVFDRIEIGFCSAWAEADGGEAMDQLQQQNRIPSNEKSYDLTILESARIPSLLFDTQGTLKNLNPAAAQLLGARGTPGGIAYGDPPTVGLGWLEPELNRFLAGEELERDFESSLGTAGGDLAFEVHLCRMLDDSRKFTGVVVSLYDISTQKQNARELLEANLSLSLMMEVNRMIARGHSRQEVLTQFCSLVVNFSGFQSAWFCDEQLQLEVADESEAFAGYRQLLELCPPDLPSWACFASSWGAPACRALAVPIHQGSRRFGMLWLGLNDRGPLAARELQLYVSLCADLAHGLDRFRLQEETRLAGEALSASEERFSQFIENAPQAIQEIGRQGRIELVNAALEQLYGRPRGDLLGHSIFEFIPAEERSRVRGNLAELCRTQPAPFPYYNRIRRADGRSCEVEVTWNYRFDGQGEVSGFRAILTDVTERQRVARDLEAFTSQLEANHAELKEKSAALEQAHQELKQAQSQMLQREKMASIGQLAAGVAHEINNPLGYISSNLTNLGRYVEKLGGYIDEQAVRLEAHLDEAARQDLADQRRRDKIDYLLKDIPDLIVESLDGAQRVKEIVQNLKSFSRVDENDRRPADINQCLESTIRIVWNELKYKVSLERNYGELPPLICYPQQLNQVFMNLLVNAAQAIDKQGKISIASSCDGDRIRVVISDDGCGMSAEVQQRVFEPFFTTKPVGTGTGLGMSIVYDIVKKHGGSIRIDSRVGEGTTFTVEFPLAG